jgi:hypothetical protein
MFPITVTISNQAQFNAIMAVFQNADVNPVIPAAKKETEEIQVAANTTSKAAPKKKSAPKDSPVAAAEAAAEPAYTYEEAAHVLTTLALTPEGKEALVALLKKFNAKTLKDVRLEDLNAIVQAANAAME